MKYITLFETAEAYNAATLDLPNVSLIEENMSVGYKPWVKTKLVCKYNVTDTSNPTALITGNEQNIFTSMEIDDVMLDELVTEYTFDTTGVHTVKYELYDETKLGNSAPVFQNNNLVECIIPNSITSILPAAFQGCSSLTSIDIPDSVTSIYQYAFQDCTSLTSVTIGNSVTSIYQYVFKGCTSLSTITSYIMNAPSVYPGTFAQVSNGGTLYVPIGSSGYETWMSNQGNLGMYNWTKVEQ